MSPAQANAPAFPQAATIELSLETFSEQVGDPTALVYEVLFDRFPQMKIHFWRDSNDQIKGSMLSRTFEAISDFIGERRYADRMIMNEVVTHEGYDIPRDIFFTFFEVVRDALAKGLGPAWSLEFGRAWGALLIELSDYATAVEPPGDDLLATA